MHNHSFFNRFKYSGLIQTSLFWRSTGKRLGLAIALLLTGCGGGGSNSSAPDDKTVTILGSITGDGQEKLEQIFAPFTEKTGITVQYEGTDAFATVLPVRVDSGNAPDVALFPQPGLMADFAQNGDLVALDSLVTQTSLTDVYSDDWLNLATVNEQVYGLWARADIKSLVWYRPDVFEEKGYDIPTTWAELLALSDQIVADGGVPWCLGMESGSATGWVGTDWVEDIVLRSSGPEVYDQWVNHQIPFNAPEIKEAFETFGAIALNEDYVFGGTVGILSTPFGDSPRPLFDNPPGCYMHRQTNFIASFFPENIVPGEDVDIFLLPGINSEFGVPILAAGTLFSAFHDDPETAALMDYLATAQPHEIWVGLENYISPHQGVTGNAYSSDFMRLQADILSNAETIRFDASDLMPGSVGTGTFWSGISDYVGGKDLDTVLETIDSSWP